MREKKLGEIGLDFRLRCVHSPATVHPKPLQCRHSTESAGARAEQAEKAALCGPNTSCSMTFMCGIQQKGIGRGRVITVKCGSFHAIHAAIQHFWRHEVWAAPYDGFGSCKQATSSDGWRPINHTYRWTGNASGTEVASSLALYMSHSLREQRRSNRQ